MLLLRLSRFHRKMVTCPSDMNLQDRLSIDVRGWDDDTYSFARELLSAKDVAVAPGETFSDGNRRFVRISLATAKELLEEGLSRLCDYIDGIG